VCIGFANEGAVQTFDTALIGSMIADAGGTAPERAAHFP